MTNKSRPKTCSISLEDRGQTAQDFAIGIGLFLVAVAFIFAFVPTIIAPFAGGESGQSSQAERVASTLIDQTETGEAHNELESVELASMSGDSIDLAVDLGLRVAGDDEEIAIDRVNITVTEIDSGDQAFSTGDEYADQPSGSATRYVTTTDTGQCEPACRLVVRVF